MFALSWWFVDSEFRGGGAQGDGLLFDDLRAFYTSIYASPAGQLISFFPETSGAPLSRVVHSASVAIPIAACWTHPARVCAPGMSQTSLHSPTNGYAGLVNVSSAHHQLLCRSLPFAAFLCLSLPFSAFRCLSLPFAAFRCVYTGPMARLHLCRPLTTRIATALSAVLRPRQLLHRESPPIKYGLPSALVGRVASDFLFDRLPPRIVR